MKAFTIENETNNITLHATIQEAEAAANAELFRSEAGLAKLAANWPAARLVEIWNSLPGENPVKKFKDRATAVSRIWKAIQSLGQAAPTAEEPTPVPETTAETPETAPVPDQEASETVQPEAVTPESPEPPLLCPSRHKRPTWRRRRFRRRRRPPERRKRPQPPRTPARRGREARPAR